MTYGPVDILAIQFNTENLKGEILPVLLELVQNKIVRVIDLVIVQKYADSHHEALELQQLAPDLLGVFDPLNVEVSGLIQAEDIDLMADKMDKDAHTALLLVENLWPLKFVDAVVRAKGKVLANERISLDVVNETLDLLAQAES